MGDVHVMTSWLIRCVVFFRCLTTCVSSHTRSLGSIVCTCTCVYCTLYIQYCGQCGHRVVHNTCVRDTKKCRTITAFSSRFCLDMQAASWKIFLSHTITITLCVSGMKKWVSARFLRIGLKKLRIGPIRTFVRGENPGSKYLYLS